MKFTFTKLGTCVLGLCLPFAVFGDAFDTLNYRFSGSSQPLRSVAFGNGTYIAVGDNGTILSSSDTITWIPRSSGTTNRLNGIAYGGNGFVAVGESISGTPSTILSSADGISWTQRSSPLTNKLSGVCYGSGRYVAVGTKGKILTSTNAVNWISINTGAPYDFNGVAAGSLFVTAGDSGTIMTSSDGLAWTLRFSGTFARLTAVCSGALWSAVGEGGTVLTSPDSITWTVRTSGTANDLNGITYDGVGRYGAVGTGGTFLVSDNGTNWTLLPAMGTNDLLGVTYANANFLATGAAGSIQAGIAWLPRNSGTSELLTSAIYQGGKFYSAGGSSSNIVLVSSNGAEWATAYLSSGSGLNAITYGSNGFVAVGNQGAVLTSSNGIDWSGQILGGTNTFFCVGYGNGVYLALGRYSTPPFFLHGVMYRSTNGVDWSGPMPLSFSTDPRDIAFANNIFVAVGQIGAITTSPDGLDWTSQSSGAQYTLTSVVYGNGLFVVDGLNTPIVTSPDGTNWTTQAYGGEPVLGFGELGFVAIDEDPFSGLDPVVTSPDGITWTKRPLVDFIRPPGIQGGVTYGNGTYVIVGDSGMIRQSTPINAQAAPFVSGFPTANGFALQAICQPGYNYRIQTSSNLNSAVWTDLSTFASTQAVTSILDSTATNRPIGFYRVKSP